MLPLFDATPFWCYSIAPIYLVFHPPTKSQKILSTSDNGLVHRRNTIPMIQTSLVKSYEYTAEVILTQVNDLKHEESLFQLLENGHSINWLLGHIVSSRTSPLQTVGAVAVWSEEDRSRYRHGSRPIGQDESGVLQLAQLVDIFGHTQNRLIDRFNKMDALALAQPSGFAANSVLDSLLYFHFHESYHVGQITVVAGSDG